MYLTPSIVANIPATVSTPLNTGPLLLVTFFSAPRSHQFQKPSPLLAGPGLQMLSSGSPSWLPPLPSSCDEALLDPVTRNQAVISGLDSFRSPFCAFVKCPRALRSSLQAAMNEAERILDGTERSRVKALKAAAWATTSGASCSASRRASSQHLPLLPLFLQRTYNLLQILPPRKTFQALHRHLHHPWHQGHTSPAQSCSLNSQSLQHFHPKKELKLLRSRTQTIESTC